MAPSFGLELTAAFDVQLRDGDERAHRRASQRRDGMSDWLHNLPVAWIALLVFATTYLAAGVIGWLVLALAVGERGRAFKAISGGLLPPLGIIFGLLVSFVAV